MHTIFANISVDMEQVKYMLICFTLVCLVLCSMWFGTFVIGIFFKKIDERCACKAAGASAKPAVQTAGGTAVSANVAAVISSAIHATMDGAAHRIVSIRSSDGSAANVSPEIAAVISAATFTSLCGSSAYERAPIDFGWANSGRSAIFASKNPKK